MEYRKLELTLISAENLKDVNLISKMNVYAIVSVANDPQSNQKIPPDHIGGRNPVWNSTVTLTVPAAQAGPTQYLRILLRTERALGDRDVGEVTIPLEEILSAGGGDGGAKFSRFQVRKPRSNKTKGVINLSYRLHESVVKAVPPVMAYPPPQVAVPPVMAYPPPQVGGGYYGQGYGYGAAAAAPGYGYGYQPQLPRRNNGPGFGMGLLGGALGGMLIGDMLSDDAGAYDAGYDAGFDDGGGYDAGFDDGDGFDY